MFKKILLAADGSEYSLRAADKAIHLAKKEDDSIIHLVYVLDDRKSKTEVLHSWNIPDIGEHRKEAVKPVEEKLAASGARYEVEFLRGEPGPVIVDYANDHQFDVVVIGSRGLNALQEFLLGSVSHKVAKRAACSVLIVK